MHKEQVNLKPDSSQFVAAFKHEQPKKMFEKIYIQIMAHLAHIDPTMQAQGLKALLTIANSQYILYIQE